VCGGSAIHVCDALLLTRVCVSCGEFGVCVSRACSLPLDSTVQPQRKEWLSWSSLKIGNTLPIFKTIINRSCALLRLSALCKPRVSSCATLRPTCIQIPLAHAATSTCIVVNARAYITRGICCVGADWLLGDCTPRIEL
jgi:hypothetical protein